jgi:lipopolysaccharide transport system ATP-binding protein
MSSIIEIRGLGKKYKLAEAQRYLALRDMISHAGKKLFGKRPAYRTGREKEFWALRDIDLDIQQGDRVGIIGRNGAGKSTLLKILSKITPPTTGDINLHGRVASLLEVGTGFHPELTGRENIFLNGAILGLSKKEIQKKLDEIVEFSGVENFIDMPLKHYSSGMELRLAFSVAAHLEPEILLIDEVLAVGDMEFQKKCLGKMEEVSKKEGRTILFVSHDLNAVSRLTNKCIILEKGKMVCNDITPKTIQYYYQQKDEQKGDYINDTDSVKPAIRAIRIFTSEPGGIHIYGKPLKVEFEIQVPEKTEDLSLSFQVMNLQLQPVLHFWIVDSAENRISEKGIYILQCLIPESRLYKGEYFINTYLGDNRGKEVFDLVQDTAPFEVVMTGLDPGHSFGWQTGASIYRENHEWHSQKKL